MSREDQITLKRTYRFWFVICLLIFSAAFYCAPNRESRELFSDQAAHIAAALSIGHDGDLRYTLEDLILFRATMPAEKGPRGLFLKTGNDGNLYYAKPFLYALFAAPCVAVLGLNGFILLNVICFFSIGAVFFSVLLPRLGVFYSILSVIFLMIFSPFLAWIPIAHPDLFIAALLSVGGYFLICRESELSVRMLGAFIIGMAVYEKPTFMIILPFVLVSLVGCIQSRHILYSLFFLFLGWSLPTIVNLFQDGNLLAYQGVRFYVTKAPFPMESGWNLPKSSLDHVFRPSMIVQALISNMSLLPQKIFDFLFGRQTGILLYFPVALALMIILTATLKIRSILLVTAFLAYLAVYWLAFPTNGYGGAGTYGSRYMMQAIPLIVLAFSWEKPSESLQKRGTAKWTKAFLLAGAVLSVVFQYGVLPPSEKLVREPRLFLNSRIARFFPLESSILPFVASTLPGNFRHTDASKKNTIYKTGATAFNDYQFPFQRSPVSAHFVLYQKGTCQAPPPLGVLTNRPIAVALQVDGRFVKEIQATSGLNELVQFDKEIFEKSFFDLQSKGEIRWKEMALQVSPGLKEEAGATGWLEPIFFPRLPVFQGYGAPIKPKQFHEKSIGRYCSWSYDEEWGVWTDGRYAFLTMNPGELSGLLLFKFDVHAYTPPESPRRVVNVLVNGRKKGAWIFFDGTMSSAPRFLVTPEDMMNSRYVNIAFEIEDPISPVELGRSCDPRKLGLGLNSLEVIKIEETHGSKCNNQEN